MHHVLEIRLNDEILRKIIGLGHLPGRLSGMVADAGPRHPGSQGAPWVHVGKTAKTKTDAELGGDDVACIEIHSRLDEPTPAQTSGVSSVVAFPNSVETVAAAG